MVVVVVVVVVVVEENIGVIVNIEKRGRSNSSRRRSTDHDW